MRREVLRMERVTCIRHGRETLNNFNFQLFEGEVMGLVPLDSYGLDEFIDCMCNNRQLLYGRIYIRERLVNTYAVRPRTKNNVYSILKDENLIQGLPAADNIFLIREGYRGFFIDDTLIQKQLKRLLGEVGMDISIKKKVKELTVFEKYIIEIIKAAVGKADVVILRDIGSSLHPEEMEKLEKIVRSYADKGLSFIYISTRTEELAQLCDRASLMSRGRIIKILEHDKIRENLEGHYFFPYQLLKENESDIREEGQKIFRCENIWHNSIQNMSFDVEKGECLLIHNYNDLDWNDFLSLLSGEKPQKGRIWWEGRKKKNAKRDIAIILENPAETMLYSQMSYEDNLCLHLDHRIGNLWWSRNKRRSIVKEITGREITGRVKDLSLREKYELVYNKIMLQNPRIIFCMFPYRNVDIKTRQLTNKFLQKYLAAGIAVVIITLDMRDGAAIADRILLFGKNQSRMIFGKEEFEKIVLNGSKHDSVKSTKDKEKHDKK